MDVSQKEKEEMRRWLLSKEIRFEFRQNIYDHSFDLLLIDYRNNCVLVQKNFRSVLTRKLSNDRLRDLVIKFEEEAVFPILFGEREYPTIRLIRDD